MQVWFYLLLVLHVVGGCIVKDHGQTEQITAYTGESVLLPCYCTEPHTTPARVTWNKYNKNRDTWDEISNKKRKRVQLFNDHSPANLSLLISHLTEKDGGQYMCSVNGGGFTDITLTVKGCTLEDHGQTSITAYTGESVLLPCYCADPHTKPEKVTWNKYNINQWKEMSSKSGQYKKRVQLFNDHSPANLSLLISHLTEEDGGVYRCIINGGRFTDITLNVKGCTLTDNTKTLYITAQRGESVLLPCSCTDLRLKPQAFTWKKYNQTSKNWKRILIESDQYRNRVQLFNDHSLANLSLLISHLTNKDGGVYQCHYKKEEYTKVKLTVEGLDNPTTQVVTVHQLSSPSTMDPKDPSKSKFLIYAAVVVLLLLMVLGGVIYWRYRVQRRRQMESCESNAEQRGDQETQNDPQALYATVNNDGKSKKLEDMNDSEVLYATANTEDTKTQDMDDVTYSTVVHSKTLRPENKLMDDEDTTEYASIKLN